MLDDSHPASSRLRSSFAGGDSMRVLCAGDLHIGRRPTRLPPHVDCRPLCCSEMWVAAVDYAINQSVDVVALSGDLVDQANKYFEALGPLERGLRRLAEAGIVTVAVAGNHDHDVLPQLSRTFGPDIFRLLGRGGQWERTTINGQDGDRLYVDGWSFPTEHVSENPLASYNIAFVDDAPILGLLHSDLDIAGSRYAPVRLSELRACRVSFWLLGHVHRSALHVAPGAPPVLYPGSLQALDPGEPGMHGVWLLELRRGVPAEPRRIPLASMRYESIEVDIADVTDVSQLRQVVVERCRATISERIQDSGPLRYLSVRLRIVGRTPIHRYVEGELNAIAADWEYEVGGMTAYVERLEVETRPALDLPALAKGSDAAAVLARLLINPASEHPSAEYSSLMKESERVVSALRWAKSFKSVATMNDGIESPPLEAVIEQQATRLLEELLTQKELT